MLRFYAASFSAAIGALSRASTMLALATDFSDDAVRAFLQSDLQEATGEFRQLSLSRVLNGQIERLSKRLAEDPGPIDRAVFQALLAELSNNLLTELSEAWFLMIPADRRNLYQQYYPVFSEAVTVEFPEATFDIASAARCLALDEWTAGVFHLMRCLELGLHSLAAELSVPMANVGLENWKNVIDQIERQIREMEAGAKTPSKRAKIQFYSELASHFRYFKDAWRNHVAHSRAKYDEREAFEVFHNVRTFMQQMAVHKAAAGGEGEIHGA